AQAVAAGIVEGDAGLVHLAARRLADDQQARCRRGLHHRARAHRQLRLAQAAGADAGQQGVEGCGRARHPATLPRAAAYNPRMRFPDYPFTPHRFEVRPGIAMSFLDEGPRDGDVVVMLHGNPSWSFYWRHLVSGLSDRYRCIVPDHVGMGLSDRPDDAPSASPRYDYTLQSRIDDLDALLQHLGIDGPVTLAVHDWGGMIGFGWALRDPARVKRLVITNTAAFPLPAAKKFPKRLAMGRDSRPGGWLIRRYNLFARGAARFGTERTLSKAVREAYAGVYDGW